jgi:hypothetical protein
LSNFVPLFLRLSGLGRTPKKLLPVSLLFFCALVSAGVRQCPNRKNLALPAAA